MNNKFKKLKKTWLTNIRISLNSSLSSEDKFISNIVMLKEIGNPWLETPSHTPKILSIEEYPLAYAKVINHTILVKCLNYFSVKAVWWKTYDSNSDSIIKSLKLLGRYPDIRDFIRVYSKFCEIHHNGSFTISLLTIFEGLPNNQKITDSLFSLFFKKAFKSKRFLHGHPVN